LPDKLKEIRQMPLDHLINELQNLDRVDESEIEIPNWGISFGTFLLITLAIALLCLCRKWGCFSKLCSAKGLCEYESSKTKDIELNEMPAQTSGQNVSSAEGQTTLSSSRRPVDRMIRLIYPRLSTEDKTGTDTINQTHL
jgi:hypothetical protein